MTGREETTLRCLEAHALRMDDLAVDLPAHRLFEAFDDFDIDGLRVVNREGEVLRVLSRATFQRSTRCRFSRDLYHFKSVQDFIDSDAERLLHLPAALSIAEAVAIGLQREPAARYDPIACEGEDGTTTLLDFTRILEAQQRVLSEVLGKVDQQRDELQSAQRRLSRAATRDALTGLWNRPRIEAEIGRLVKRQGQSDAAFALLFLDMDGFKAVNDCLGHAAGDNLLRHAAERMRRVAASWSEGVQGSGKPVLARMGGDEFVVLLRGTADPCTHGVALAERLLSALSDPFELDGRPAKCGASIGVTPSTHLYATRDEVLLDADAAMYEAKRRGRGCVVLFTQEMRGAHEERIELERGLAEAVVDERLELYYQPIVCMGSSRLVGVEALARWEHRGRPVSPGVFIPIAEEIGAIHDLGRWVLERAMRDALRLSALAQRDLTMSVNVSRRQLLEPSFIDHVAGLLRRTGARAELIKLEVTENAVLQDENVMVPVLDELKRMGFRLSMDDFGVGESSLTCLRTLPIDIVKVDRAFVQSLEEDRACTAVLQAVIDLTRNLGKAVIAEGIETAAQLAQLQGMDCDYGQGYYFSRPVPLSDMAQRVHVWANVGFSNETVRRAA